MYDINTFNFFILLYKPNWFYVSGYSVKLMSFLLIVGGVYRFFLLYPLIYDNADDFYILVPLQIAEKVKL